MYQKPGQVLPERQAQAARTDIRNEDSMLRLPELVGYRERGL